MTSASAVLCMCMLHDVYIHLSSQISWMQPARGHPAITDACQGDRVAGRYIPAREELRPPRSGLGPPATKSLRTTPRA